MTGMELKEAQRAREAKANLAEILERRPDLTGELVEDTVVRFYYRRRCDNELAFVDKRSPMIHIAPCNACPDSTSGPR